MVFFFQAEDGIRARTVTGVQTCALPICLRRHGALAQQERHHEARRRRADRGGDEVLGMAQRSEERRVGKECRFWGAGAREIKKSSCSGGARRKRVCRSATWASGWVRSCV